MSPLRFVDIAGRRVAWRSQGSGPAAVLLHGSPQSSRAVAALGHAAAASGLAAIMPDTPGAGASEALDGNISIGDLAAALGAFVDAIGLGRFALYGSHTGAAIATAFAAIQPGRVTGLVLDGMAAWTEAERATYRDSYAPPFLPAWDGGHMTWLWSRLEAQSIFFPWHRQIAETWRGVDLSPPGHLHRNAMDMLESGDAYRPIYQASLAFDPAKYLPNVKAPVRMMMAARDVLAGHAARPELNHMKPDFFDNDAALYAEVVMALAAWSGDAAPREPRETLFRRGTLAGIGRPLVLLHAAGASSRVFASALPEWAHKRPVIAFDLPGHGFSGGDMPASAAVIAAAVTEASRHLGLDDYDVAGQRFGGLIAHAMAGGKIKASDLCPRVTAPDCAARGAVSLEPEWDGSHLLRAWRVAFRQALWDPWYDNSAAAARNPPDDMSPATIQGAAVDLLRAGKNWILANAIEAGAADYAG